MVKLRGWFSVFVDTGIWLLQIQKTKNAVIQLHIKKSYGHTFKFLIRIKWYGHNFNANWNSTHSALELKKSLKNFVSIIFYGYFSKSPNSVSQGVRPITKDIIVSHENEMNYHHSPLNAHTLNFIVSDCIHFRKQITLHLHLVPLIYCIRPLFASSMSFLYVSSSFISKHWE